MDRKTTTSLDPTLQATYDKIMGNSQKTVPETQTKTTSIEHIPQPVSESPIPASPTPQPAKSHPISAFTEPIHHATSGAAIGEPQTAPAKKNHRGVKVLFLIGVVGGIIYVIFWLKFFNLTLPF